MMADPVKGGTQLLTVKLTSGDLNFKVRLLEHRSVFGRSEWRVAPMAGNGSVWIQEASFTDGVKWASPSERGPRKRRRAQYGPPVEEGDISIDHLDEAVDTGAIQVAPATDETMKEWLAQNSRQPRR